MALLKHIGPALLTLVSITTLPQTTVAQTERSEAHASFQNGLNAADRKDFEAAAKFFQQAYEAQPHYAVLYNLGMAWVGAGHPDRAHQTLRKYLSDGATQLSESRRNSVARQLTELEKLLAFITIRTQPDGLMIELDGVNLGPSPISHWVAEGTHTLSLRRGEELLRHDLIARKGEPQHLNFRLTDPSPTSVPAPTKQAALPQTLPPSQRTQALLRPTEIPSEKASTGYDTYALIATGSALAFTATTIGIYLWNDKRFSTWEATDRELRATSAPTPDDVIKQRENNDLLDSIHRWDSATVVFGIGAGVLATSALTFALLPARKEDHATLRMGLGLTSMEFTSTW